MGFIDKLGLALAFLGVYNLYLYIRFVLPRNVVPLVSKQLDEIEALLNSAVAVIAIPEASEIRVVFAILRNQFLRLRTTSHRAPSIYKQLKLALLTGLTCQLFLLKSQVENLKLEVERVMDEHQLASVPATQVAATTALPVPAAVVVTPAANVAEPPPPAAVS